ncbi:unnamed protein product [Cunninghamella blakesleeana]
MNWWNHSTTCPTNEISQYVTDQGLTILKELQLKETNCFKKVILELKQGCEQVLENEQIQTQYALALTLCELSIAQIPIPLDCYLKDSFSTESKCINKLSMLPQTWTTYSGYFRNVISICFALRCPMEKKLLQQMKENLTLHLINNYDVLLKKQDDFILWKNNEQSMLNSIQQEQMELWNELTLLQDHFYEEIHDVLSIIRESKRELNDSYIYHQLLMNNSQQSIDHLLFNLYKSLQLVSENIEFINTNMMISSILQNQSLLWWDHWQYLQNITVQQWKDMIMATNQSFFHLFNQTEKKLIDLNDNLDSMQLSITSFLQPFQLFLNSLLNLFYTGLEFTH